MQVEAYDVFPAILKKHRMERNNVGGEFSARAYLGSLKKEERKTFVSIERKPR